MSATSIFSSLPASMTAVLLAAISLNAASSEDHHGHEIEEVVVTAAFQKKAAETATPTISLSGEQLLEKTANTLGETLRNEIGMSSASFGPNLGHPIIRGQSGNRVSVLQNGVGVTDASNQSPDHAEGVEPALAERIEIIRGPATLLYGSGAVGGVINVIDRRVPESVPERPAVLLEHSYNQNAHDQKSVFRLDAGTGRFAIHADGFTRENDNVEIDGLAIDQASLEALGALMHGETTPDAVGHDALENTDGFIANSDAKADGASLGFSYIGTRGFLGIAVSRLGNTYGLPAGAHSHGGEHEDATADHGTDEHDEEIHEDVMFVRIDMDKTRYDLRGGLDFSGDWIENIRAWVSYTDYEHSEIEYFEDGGREVGTTYANEGLEGRLVMSRRSNGKWSGVYGFQFSETEFGALGEEAFIPESDIRNLGLFGVERYERNNLVFELGLRFDRNHIDTGLCKVTETAFSAGASLIYNTSDNANWLLGLSRAERTPTVEELYSNFDGTGCDSIADDKQLVLHAATNLLEIGNPDLETEVSNNLEIGYRLHAGRATGELSVYYNQINDYIFLDLTGETIDDQSVAVYGGRDARFSGVEGRLSFNVMERAGFGMNWGLFGDYVRARFDRGGNVPRIPAAKLGTELELFGDRWTMHLHASRVFEQDDVAEIEIETSGYTLVSVYADYHWPLKSAAEIKLFARAGNLLDERVRNHASFLKDYAPEAGRSIIAGIRFTY